MAIEQSAAETEVVGRRAFKFGIARTESGDDVPGVGDRNVPCDFTIQNDAEIVFLDGVAGQPEFGTVQNEGGRACAGERVRVVDELNIPGELQRRQGGAEIIPWRA